MNMNLEYLFTHLGENKITQEIKINHFEQSTHYQYCHDYETFYEDLLKKRNKSISSTSLTSLSSASNLVDKGDVIYYVDDPFMYLMYYIKNPSVSLMSKDVVQHLLREYRKTLYEDEQSFSIKKLTKSNKQMLLNMLSSGDKIDVINEVIINYFSHFLKINIVVIVKSTLMKAIFCNEDNFDTVVIKDTYGRGMFKLLEHGENKLYVISWREAKIYLIDKKFVDKRFVDNMSVIELRAIAVNMDISISKLVNGKSYKLLKDELKIEILKKI